MLYLMQNQTKTYTVGFNYDNFDETVYAKDLSKILEIKNTSKIISDEEFLIH